MLLGNRVFVAVQFTLMWVSGLSPGFAAGRRVVRRTILSQVRWNFPADTASFVDTFWSSERNGSARRFATGAVTTVVDP